MFVAVLLVMALAVPAADAIAEPVEQYSIFLQEFTIDVRRGEPDLRADLKRPMEKDVECFGIVKYASPTTEATLDQLYGLGLEPVRYLPYYAWVVRGQGEAVMAAGSLPEVSWVGAYHPAYKISGYIGHHEFEHPQRRDDPLLLLRVRVFPTERGAAVADELTRLGIEVREIVEKEVGDLLVVHTGRDRVNDIARLGSVEWIEEVPEYVLHNNRTKWVLQTNQLNNTSIWNHGIHGEGQMIGIMDSGLDYNSCFFRDPEGDGFGSSHRKVQAYRWPGGAEYDGCDPGHGTHVTGTVLGEDIFGSNDAYNGMAYKARLTFQDVGQDDTWSCTLGTVNIPSNLEASYQDSRNDGARLHTNSWGSTDNTYDSMAQDVDNFMWNNKDFLVLFAMGNSGSGSATIGSPATAKNCVSVGATQQYPNQSSMAGYSSRGPTYDNRRKPTVVAPGGSSSCYINSANNHAGNPPSQTCGVQGNPFQGTSPFESYLLHIWSVEAWTVFENVWVVFFFDQHLLVPLRPSIRHHRHRSVDCDPPLEQ